MVDLTLDDGLADELSRRLAEIDTLTTVKSELLSLNQQQEVVIRVMRQRIWELEMELVNARCASVDHHVS